MSRQNATNLIILFSLIALLASFLPIDFFSPVTPATGADLGSHYWAFNSALKHGAWSGHFHVWNPGNLAGEPHLVHYFPFPFYVMTVLASLMSPFLAFNIGTYLPILFIPFSVYFFLNRLNLKFPSPILGAIAAVAFLLNDSYSAWGGNITSTLCGQFSHLYALNTLFIGAALFSKEVRSSLPPWRSSIFFAFTALSHAYVALSIPVLVLTIAWFFRVPSRQAFKVIGQAGLASFGLVAFWLIPAITHQKWANQNASRWLEWVEVSSYLPIGLMPFLLAGLIALAIYTLYFKVSINNLRVVTLFLIAALFNLVLIFILPSFNLVDIRAIPQIHLFLAIAAAVILGTFTPQVFSKQIYLAIAPALVLLGWSYYSQSLIPNYTNHAYSGWDKKPGYEDLINLSEQIRGTFSEPRLAFEHGDKNTYTGTINVFEMLPYFSGRSTLRSLYFESSHFSRIARVTESLISERPSCPLSSAPCLSNNLEQAYEKLLLLGVNQVILSSDHMLAQAEADHRFKFQQRFGNWSLFILQDDVNLVEVLNTSPELVTLSNYKKQFMDWYVIYKAGKIPIIDESVDMSDWKFEQGQCHPRVEATFNLLTLYTDCPGRPHYVKFAYHETLQANTGDSLTMASPGFFIISPSEKRVEIRFGQSRLWMTAKIISLLTILGLLSVNIFSRIRSNRKS